MIMLIPFLFSRKFMAVVTPFDTPRRALPGPRGVQDTTSSHRGLAHRRGHQLMFVAPATVADHIEPHRGDSLRLGPAPQALHRLPSLTPGHSGAQAKMAAERTAENPHSSSGPQPAITPSGSRLRMLAITRSGHHGRRWPAFDDAAHAEALISARRPR